MLEIPPLPESTILLVEVGSTAHGTGIPGGENHDEMGVVVEMPKEILGLDPYGYRTVMQRTQPEGSRSGPGDTDRTLHSLRRFVRMAAGGNPSILMAMWAPVLHVTNTGLELQALGPSSVGRHVIPRYRGYMQSQAMRLLGLRGVDDDDGKVIPLFPDDDGGATLAKWADRLAPYLDALASPPPPADPHDPNPD